MRPGGFSIHTLQNCHQRWGFIHYIPITSDLRAMKKNIITHIYISQTKKAASCFISENNDNLKHWIKLNIWFFQAICSPYWDGASCFPPSLADTVVTIPCMATYFTKRFNTNCESCFALLKEPFIQWELLLMGFACRFNSFFMLKGKLEWILLTLHPA